MPLLRVDLQTRNNSDWVWPFVLYASPGATPPWANVATWAAGASYQSTEPASVVVSPLDGDLYVANPANAVTSWSGGVDFISDLPSWIHIGVAAGYSGIPYDLTGVTLKMSVCQLSGDGLTIANPRIHVIDLTSDGSDPSGAAAIIIDDAPGGVGHLQVPKARTRNVSPGVYGFDMVATSLSGTSPVLWGLMAVAQGSTP